jgi:hypothetical protein
VNEGAQAHWGAVAPKKEAEEEEKEEESLFVLS